MNQLIYNVLTGESKIVEVPDHIESLDELKQNKLNQLMDNYNNSVFTGFTSAASGESVIYGYSQQDQLNYTKIANTFALNPNKTSAIVGSISHGVMTLTKEQFILFVEDAEKYEISSYMKRKNIEQMISDANNIEELNLIDISL